MLADFDSLHFYMKVYIFESARKRRIHIFACEIVQHCIRFIPSITWLARCVHAISSTRPFACRKQMFMQSKRRAHAVQFTYRSGRAKCLRMNHNRSNTNPPNININKIFINIYVARSCEAKSNAASGGEEGAHCVHSIMFRIFIYRRRAQANSTKCTIRVTCSEKDGPSTRHVEHSFYDFMCKSRFIHSAAGRRYGSLCECVCVCDVNVSVAPNDAVRSGGRLA